MWEHKYTRPFYSYEPVIKSLMNHNEFASPQHSSAVLLPNRWVTASSENDPAGLKRLTGWKWSDCNSFNTRWHNSFIACIDDHQEFSLFYLKQASNYWIYNTANWRSSFLPRISQQTHPADVWQLSVGCAKVHRTESMFIWSTWRYDLSDHIQDHLYVWYNRGFLIISCAWAPGSLISKDIWAWSLSEAFIQRKPEPALLIWYSQYQLIHNWRETVLSFWRYFCSN